MGLRTLTNWNDPIFRKISREVEKFDERLWTLLDDMRETLAEVGGYGCAAYRQDEQYFLSWRKEGQIYGAQWD